MPTRLLPLSVISVLLLSFVVAGTATATSAVNLGTAAKFAVLAGSGVTNTGPSVINGDLGTSPNNTATGFPPGLVNGTIHAADGVAAQAQADLTTAYKNVAGQPCDSNLSGQDLGGLTLTTGAYCFDSAAQLTGTLTLNAQGDPSALFLFQIGSALTTASSSSVRFTNGAQPCNVYWQVGSSATLGAATDFAGNILALTSITLVTGATINGRALARNGAVTLDTNTISKTTCSTSSATECTSTLNGGSYGAIGVPDGATCTLVGVTVGGDATVGTNARLMTTSGTQVGDDVSVGANARLTATSGTQVGGDVVATGARSVSLIDTDVAGSIMLTGTKGGVIIGSAGCRVDPTVGGGIRVVNTGGTVAICHMTVGRSVVVRNTHAVVGLFDNVVSGNVTVRSTYGYGLWIVRNSVTGYLLDKNNHLTTRKHYIRDNTVGGDLMCYGNSVNPIHRRNTVAGVSHGECAV